MTELDSFFKLYKKSPPHFLQYYTATIQKFQITLWWGWHTTDDRQHPHRNGVMMNVDYQICYYMKHYSKFIVKNVAMMAAK